MCKILTPSVSKCHETPKYPKHSQKNQNPLIYITTSQQNTIFVLFQPPPAAQPNYVMAEGLLEIPDSARLQYGGEKLSNTHGSVLDSVVRGGFVVRNLGTLTDRDNGLVPNKGFDLTWIQVPCAADDGQP